MEDKNIGNQKNNRILQIAIFVVVFAVAFFGTQYLMKPNVGKELEKVAAELNKKCPMQVDNDTRLDKTGYVAPKTIQYHYTILTVDKDSLAIDANDTKNFLVKQAQDNLDNAPGMKLFREQDVTLKYFYQDKNGKPLFDFAINPTKK